MLDDQSGYKKPPVAGRFRKGKSGNPLGRPRGRKSQLPYEDVLGQMVSIRDEGHERRVTVEEAFLMQILRQALRGDSAAAHILTAAIEDARGPQPPAGFRGNTAIDVNFVAPGSVNSALEPLRMARKLDRYRDSARMALEPWIVEAALGRFEGRRLTVEQQRIVVAATRTPHKVSWPDWWQVRCI